MRQKARKRKKTPVSEQQNNNGTKKHPREGNFPPAGVFFFPRGGLVFDKNMLRD